MMNFRSKNIGVQEGSNVGSIQSVALRGYHGGGGSSMNLSNHIDSNSNLGSLLVLDGDDSRNSGKNEGKSSSFGFGNFGEQIPKAESAGYLGGPRKVFSGNDDF